MVELLERYQVDCIFDVGANIGQSGNFYRQIGFNGTLVSFEPVRALFEKLAARSARDRDWTALNHALGDKTESLEINVSGGHAGSSSILPMTENIPLNAPSQKVVRTETIQVRTLDEVMPELYPEGERCFLKLDVQGYEKNVLMGGLSALPRVVGVKLEMSLVRNYEGETMLFDMLPYVESLGFRLVQFENGWSNDKTGELYQVDGIFFRTDALGD